MNKYYFLSLFFLLFYNSSFCQNLIPNSNFEAANLCQKYKETCFPKGWKSTSLKLAKYQGVKGSGNKSISLLHFDGAREFDRRFIQAKLLYPLEAGKSYKLNFDYKSDFPRAKHIGFLFTSAYYFDKNNTGLTDHQEVLEISLNETTDPTWVNYSMVFTANSNASYLIIGNFKSDDNTKLLPLTKKAARRLKKSYEPQNRVQYQLDNIKLEPLDFELHFDEAAALKEIYYDNIRHRFEVKKLPPESAVVLFEEDFVEAAEVDEQEENIAVPLQPGLNTLLGVEFEFATTILTATSFPNLSPILNYLREDSNAKLLILGHTDNVGSDRDNLILSRERAEAIYQYLIMKGIGADRLSFRGLGATRPIADNDTESGRQKNRRVEVEIKD